MRKEDRLIRLLSATKVPERHAREAAAILSSPQDWEHIKVASQREGVACILYRNLTKLDLPADAASIARRELGPIYYTNAARNIGLIKRAEEAASALGREGVASIVLKGAALAEELYGDIGLRPSTDIDLLVRREDLPLAHETLIRTGYYPPESYRDFLSAPAESGLNSLVYIPSDGSGSFIHLHWHIINSTWPIESVVGRVDMRRIWSRARPAGSGKNGFLSLCPDHLLIYLCHHGMHHSFYRLILACDVNEAVRRYGPEADWAALMAEAGSFGLGLIVYCALRAVSGIFDADTLHSRAWDGLTGSERRFAGLFARAGLDPASSYCAYLFNERGLSGKARFLARTAVPSKLVMAQNFSIRCEDVGITHHMNRIATFFGTLRKDKNTPRG